MSGESLEESLLAGSSGLLETDAVRGISVTTIPLRYVPLPLPPYHCIPCIPCIPCTSRGQVSGARERSVSWRYGLKVRGGTRRPRRLRPRDSASHAQPASLATAATATRASCRALPLPPLPHPPLFSPSSSFLPRSLLSLFPRIQHRLLQAFPSNSTSSSTSFIFVFTSPSP